MNRQIIRAPSALRNFLQQSLSRTSSSILLITSEPATDNPPESSNQKAIENYVNQSKFTVGVQMGLKHIHFKSISAYTTPTMIDEAIEIAKRGGACQNIIGKYMNEYERLQ